MKKRRLAICSVPIPPGRDRHSCVLMPFGVICLGWFTSGLGVSLWRSRRSCRGTGTELRRERDWRRGACALLRNRIGLAMLSAGSTLGLRAPNLRQRVFDSLDSPQGLPERQSALYAWLGLHKSPSLQKALTPQSPPSCSQSPGTRKDPPGSDLWPGGSCCISMLPARSIVQTRAAPKRRGVGLHARSGVEAALRLAGRVGLY